MTAVAMPVVIVAGLTVLLAVVGLLRGIRRVSPGTNQVVERLGRYHTPLPPGLHMIVPFVDRVRATVDLREQAVPLPQVVVTADSYAVSIDMVVHLQVTRPVAAVYEIADHVQAVERVVASTLRTVVGTMSREQALTATDQISARLAEVLGAAADRWGVSVNWVEVRAIAPVLSA